MRQLFITGLLCVVLSSCTWKSQDNNKKTNLCRTEIITIKSEILGHDRNLLVSLPYGYENTSDTYPVFVTTDAQDLFSFASSTAGLLSNQVSLPLIPKMIVIGILNRGEKERRKDFAPKVDTIPWSGDGELFIEFIENELKPYFENNYRTQPFWILQGHSYLGMFSTYLLLNKPDLFNAMIISSPGLPLIESEIDKKSSNIETSTPHFIYLSRGEKEPKEIAEKDLELLHKLKDRLSSNENFNVKVDINSTEDHHSNKMISIIHGLKYIFDGYITPKPYGECTKEEIKNHYNTLSERYGYTMSIPENIIR